jgi:hypothetical protein
VPPAESRFTARQPSRACQRDDGRVRATSLEPDRERGMRAQTAGPIGEQRRFPLHDSPSCWPEPVPPTFFLECAKAALDERGASPSRPAWKHSESRTAVVRHHRSLLGAPILDHAAELDKCLQVQDMEARREASGSEGATPFSDIHSIPRHLRPADRSSVQAPSAPEEEEMERIARSLTVLLAASALLAGAPAATPAETFDLYIHTYCPLSSAVCGFGSYSAYRAYILEAIQEANLEWEAVGISFRPAFIAVPVAHPDYERARCEDDVTTAVNETQLFQDWRADVAASSPKRISILLNFAPSGQGRGCCAELPTNPGIPAESLYGLLCDTSRPAFDLGAILAHELGHHFCLCHTFGWSGSTGTPMDTADWSPDDGALDFDGDNDAAQCQVQDTGPDPRWFEGWDAAVGFAGPDESAGGALRDDHEWCDLSVLDTPSAVDPGSPHKNSCRVDCFQRVDGQTDPLNFAGGNFTTAVIAMSYWDIRCRGPWVRDGIPRPAFTQGSEDRIRACYAEYREGVLQEVCATRGGDSDFDGICDADDNCKLWRNTAQRDTDGDGFGDACDFSVSDPDPVIDIDLDGLAPIVDQDTDGDGCPDIGDQHPQKSLVVTGTHFASTCGAGVEPVYTFEGADSDGDGVLDCADLDDDNDALCDEGGPLSEDAGGVPAGGCFPGPESRDPCPTLAGDGCHASGSLFPCPPEWIACFGGSCDGYYLELVPLPEPDPVGPIRFDVFQIYGRQLFVTPIAGRTASQTARLFAGDFPAARLDGAPRSRLRLELWEKGGGRAGPGRFVATVAEYDAADVALGLITQGGFVALTPGTGRSGQPTMDVASTIGFGLAPGQSPLDIDADGHPDPLDNCVFVANSHQADADQDGFGNACDADLDGDRVVTRADVESIRQCEGANLRCPSPILEPASMQGYLPPNPCAGGELARACAAADLDGNGLVDPADTELADLQVGLPPGPSSRAPSTSACDSVNCDDGDPCTVDRCRPDGTCYHLATACDDEDPCTVDFCNGEAGTCGHEPLACDDGNACTADACDPALGQCRFEAVADGASCDDLSACTAGDACVAGACTGGVPTACDDGDPCTLDGCDASTGECAFAPNACDDGNPCTADSCDGRLGCAFVALPDGTACDDGSLCTSRDACSDGSCAGVPAASCDDGNPCTVDSCDAASGACLFEPLGCDDGDPCTADSCTPATGTCRFDAIEPADATDLVAGGPFTMRWTPGAGATQSNTYRGSIPAAGLASRAGSGIYDHVCFERADLAGDGPQASADYAALAPGTAFYYVVASESGCREAMPGSDSTGAARPLPAPCRTPP